MAGIRGVVRKKMETLFVPRGTKNFFCLSRNEKKLFVSRGTKNIFSFRKEKHFLFLEEQKKLFIHRGTKNFFVPRGTKMPACSSRNENPCLFFEEQKI